MKNSQERTNRTYEQQFNLTANCDTASLLAWVEQVVASIPKRRKLYTADNVLEPVPSEVIIKIKVKTLKSK